MTTKTVGRFSLVVKKVSVGQPVSLAHLKKCYNVSISGLQQSNFRETKNVKRKRMRARLPAVHLYRFALCNVIHSILSLFRRPKFPIIPAKLIPLDSPLCHYGYLSSPSSSPSLNPTPTSAATGIESQLSFEGKIVNSNGTNIADGNYNMEFKIYTGCTNNTGSGCTLVWTEDYLDNNSDGVAFTSGTYQTNLGQYCPFAGGACTPSDASDGNTNTAVPWGTYPLYLSLQIGNTSYCTACHQQLPGRVWR